MTGIAACEIGGAVDDASSNDGAGSNDGVGAGNIVEPSNVVGEIVEGGPADVVVAGSGALLFAEARGAGCLRVRPIAG